MRRQQGLCEVILQLTEVSMLNCLPPGIKTSGGVTKIERLLLNLDDYADSLACDACWYLQVISGQSLIEAHCQKAYRICVRSLD